MKSLIIGGNIEALVANYMLADRGHDSIMVVERLKTQNSFASGPWRPVGASPLITEILSDLDLEFSDYQAEFAAAGVDNHESGILSLETAIEQRAGIGAKLTTREAQIFSLMAGGEASSRTIARELGLSPLTVRWHSRNIFAKLGVDSYEALSFDGENEKFDRFPEFQATLAGRPAKELTFDRQAFFNELAAVASLDSQALRADHAHFGKFGRYVWLDDISWHLGHFDLVIVTAPPRVWDPGYVAFDRSVTEIKNAPVELLPFDLIELGGAHGFEAVTWRNGKAMIETSGPGLPDLNQLNRLLGIESSVEPQAEIVSFETQDLGYKIGSTSRIRHEIGDIGGMPYSVITVGRAATGTPQTLSQVAEEIADIIDKR